MGSSRFLNIICGNLPHTMFSLFCFSLYHASLYPPEPELVVRNSRIKVFARTVLLSLERNRIHGLLHVTDLPQVRRKSMSVVISRACNLYACMCIVVAASAFPEFT